MNTSTTDTSWLGDERYLLFGMGARRKFIYQQGRLRDALFGDVVAQWPVLKEYFNPAEYAVTLETAQGTVTIREDAEALWLYEQGDRRALSAAPVCLPGFEANPHAPLLRALHAELLVHVMPWGPVPNLWVYPRPWYRDAAMMAIALQRTGNAVLLEPWVAGLTQTYDYNNAGHAEPDNLGQVLYLASLAGGRRLAIVDKALAAAREITQDGHLTGSSDFQPHPVYQTKWMKFGLRALGLDDSEWRIPMVPDSYSSLFWMDFRDEHVPIERFSKRYLKCYPYLNWAEAHFYREAPPEQVSADSFPLTREIGASQANYERMAIASRGLVEARWSSPHTWHAAEMFLYYLDEEK